MADVIPDAEKGRRLQILQDRQREIQRANYERKIGRIVEVMVEGQNEARGQVVGRTSQNITLNFTASRAPMAGSYANVLVTRSFPNSLVGEMVI
jgi:tRNA-2-methylthio-N6-dimethylallyladenosine synthase